jgi:hypothetical protein
MSRLCLAALAAIAGLSSPAWCRAENELLSFSQSEKGEAVATINGDFTYCDINGGFVGDPSVTKEVHDIEVASTILWGDCNIAPPYPPPTPYLISQSLGALADGQYNVYWSYTTVPPVVTLTQVQNTLWVESGEVAIFRGSFE